MKYLVLILTFITGYIAGCNQCKAQACTHDLPNCKCLKVQSSTLDTIPESMHVSTRKKGFVLSQVALSVRRNGYCIGHLDCNRKPFPVHYTVGWCQGKDEVYRATVELLNNKR
jgi:hypothetical protein